ncbi:MAG: hypothetical protein Q8S73_08180 [Deltaproteobacteria bacterium]|nr:hypothetical protein [Myxococcales bacterium]MDP3214066.1 hypothetical protein [Deltaproteobacteria bacterium]
MNQYEEAEFGRKMDAALARVRTVLDRTRDPRSPADVPHSYDDKFLLAEFLGRASVASLMLCLETVGLDEAGAAKLREWAATRSVTVRLNAHEECTFVREVTRKVDGPHEHVTEVRSFLGGKSTRTEKIVTTITEYLWSYDLRYELVAFQGPDPRDALALSSRAGRIEIKTTTNQPPRLRTVARPPLDLDVTWVLRQFDGAGRVAFSIDRASPDCHTPRRNREVEDALWAFARAQAWCASVVAYFRSEVFPAQTEHGLDLGAIDAAEVFVPAVPLFDQGGGGEVLPVGYLTAFLDEERRSLAEKRARLDVAFPHDGSVITAREAGLLVTLLHAQDVCRHFAGGVDFIEGMLRAQLVAAIGKEVTPAEFAEYMAFHHRKLFKPEYRPQPFSYAVRRPDHDPEGGITIEARTGRAMPDPIATLVTRREATSPMSFALDASTRVSFLGERYLHAWVAHQFSGRTDLSLSLVATARQFSSFLLLVGTIASADSFSPRFGIIVQNKDVLSIPLMLEQIPTPKEFRDAIESLSPEQQRFARAFRAMQLESTLFGVCVVQIKPQLEALLKLPPDSLTKEIKLTQDLLGLFMEHQIPSDLLSYDGPAEAQPAEKLARVGEYVARMHAVIAAARQRELDEAREREAFRLAEANRTPAPMPPMSAPASFGGPGAPYSGPPVMGGRGGPPLQPSAMVGAAPPMAMPMPMPSPSMPSPMPAPAPRAAPRESAAAVLPPQSAAAVAPPVVPPPTATPPRPTEAGSPETVIEGDDPMDYTRIPAALDRKFEALDEDGALRPTILGVGEIWSRRSQKSLLAEPVRKSLQADDQKDERRRAFDLLDALTKSGAMPLEHASLHVVIAATHCFDDTLLNTVIQRNVNPIERVERSSVIVATTIHAQSAAALLSDDQRERFFRGSPRLDAAT